MEKINKPYKRIFPKEKFSEMANLGKDDTGLSHGTIFISNQDSSHNARVKYYRGRPGKELPCAIISIEKNPRVIHDPFKMTSREKEEVCAFIILNYRKLITFWIRGEEILITKFLASLKKINI